MVAFTCKYHVCIIMGMCVSLNTGPLEFSSERKGNCFCSFPVCLWPLWFFILLWMYLLISYREKKQKTRARVSDSLKQFLQLTCSWNHSIVWAGKQLRENSLPSPLLWAGTPYTRPGCSKSSPTWPWWAGCVSNLLVLATLISSYHGSEDNKIQIAETNG